MNRTRLACAVLLITAASAMPAYAQDPRVRAVDSIFATTIGVNRGPGCAVGVVQNGELIYRRGYGVANLDWRQPLDGESVFYLASVSKQFTAAAVAIAAAQGKLSLDDDVRKYITELPDYGTPITIRHLIHHTSGLRDYLTLIPLSGRRADDYWSDEALLDLIARQRALNFTPGSEHLYSNTGYILLAEIIKRATGQSLREFAEENIFDPLGMDDTHFHDDPTEVVPARVIGYARTETGWRINHWFNFDKVGDGGLYSTIEDLARWDANFYTGEVGGQTLLQLLHQRGRLNNGDSIPYAFGLAHLEYRGLRAVVHSGSLAGFRTAMMRFPEQRFTAIVLCNTSTANPAALGNRVAEVYLRDQMQRVVTETGPNVLPAAVVPVSSDSAARRAAAQRAAELAVRNRTRLGDFAGSFRSDELDAVYRFAVERDTLVLHRAGTRIPLRITSSDDIFAANNATFRFARQNNVIDGLIVDAGRVRGIRFDRIRDSR